MIVNVSIIAHTPDPDKVIAASAKLCYSAVGASEIMNDLTDARTTNFIDMLTSIGHQSPLEHVSFTFAIEGVSRSLLAQITRHRLASFSVQSQRYVRLVNFEYITPPDIAQDPDTLSVFNTVMDQCLEAYNTLTIMLESRYYDQYVSSGMEYADAKRRAEKKAIEDARFVLPNASETKMVVTMNARELLHFFNLRCCNRAQWEIRALADAMLSECYKVSPVIFKNAGSPCCSGKCPEGKMSCGKMNMRQFEIEQLKKYT